MDNQTLDLKGVMSVKILRMLEGLRGTRTGAVIHRHIAEILSEHESCDHMVEGAYAAIVKSLLGILSEHVADDQELCAQLKIIQLRLSPPLSLSELDLLRSFAEELADGRVHLKEADGLHQALLPLLESFGFRRDEAITTRPQTMAASVQPVAESGNIVINVESGLPEERHEEGYEQKRAEQEVDSAFRQHLKQKRDEFQRIEHEFARQVNQVIHQADAFSTLLNGELNALREAQDVNDLEHHRRTLIHEAESLLEAHRDYTAGFHKVSEIVKDIDTSNQRLNDELNRVRLLSLTDELTGLPNRRAFQRRLEEELGRADRYDTPLCIAIMDLDEFKAINDTHGHRVGDLVLKLYAKDVFSIFRHHDMVARYGGEEFAVILSSTDIKGAMRAMNKVQRRAAKIVCKYEGLRFPLPTFSAGVAQYHAGEKYSELIHRADGAMYRAKHDGRNTITIAGEDTPFPNGCTSQNAG